MTSYPERPPPLTWLWIVLGIIIVLIGVGVVFGVLFGGAPQQMPPMYYRWWFGPFWFGWPTLIALFLIIWGISWIFRPWRRRYLRSYYWRQVDPAMQVLRERYARGEITKEQFEQMMKDLEQHR